MNLFYSYPQQTFQEVPGEITLALSISGCNLRCKGCHSTETYQYDFGNELTTLELEKLLKKFKHTSCVLFYGGEWNLPKLNELIEYIKNLGLKICLYTGRNLSYFSKNFISSLNYIKTGAFVESKGNLNNPLSNQKFYEIQNSNLLEKNYLFHS